jgi:glycosyltransferase involved in cell wall biosynthesis
LNVLVYLADECAPGFYRMIIPLREAHDQGLLNVTFRNRISQEDVCLAEVVVFQRQTDKRVYEHAVEKMKKQGKVVIYEVDDFLHGILPSSPVYPALNPGTEMYIGMDYWIRNVDALTVTRNELKKQYLRMNPNIFVLPNFMDLRLWKTPKKINKDRIVIGWAGSVTHKEDLMVCADALKDIIFKYDNVYLKMTGYVPGEFVNIFKDRLIIGQTSSFVEYSSVLDDIDIGVAPLVDHVFNECKSAIKFLEYSCMRIPTVASSIGPYRDTIIHKETGLLVKNNRHAKWITNLRHLIENEDERKRLGNNARNFVEEYFSIELNAWRWRQAYEDIREITAKKRKVF